MRKPRPYWNRCEVTDLVAMVCAGFTLEEISEITGRSSWAVYLKAKKIGMVYVPIYSRKRKKIK